MNEVMNTASFKKGFSKPFWRGFGSILNLFPSQGKSEPNLKVVRIDGGIIITSQHFTVQIIDGDYTAIESDMETVGTDMKTIAQAQLSLKR